MLPRSWRRWAASVPPGSLRPRRRSGRGRWSACRAAAAGRRSRRSAFGDLLGIESAARRSRWLGEKADHQRMRVGPGLAAEVAQLADVDRRLFEDLAPHRFFEGLARLDEAGQRREEVVGGVLRRGRAGSCRPGAPPRSPPATAAGRRCGRSSGIFRPFAGQAVVGPPQLPQKRWVAFQCTICQAKPAVA